MKKCCKCQKTKYYDVFISFVLTFSIYNIEFCGIYKALENELTPKVGLEPTPILVKHTYKLRFFDQAIYKSAQVCKNQQKTSEYAPLWKEFIQMPILWQKV